MGIHSHILWLETSDSSRAAKILLKSGALQSRALNQECNAGAVYRVKRAKLRCIKIEQTHRLSINH